ncbi:MAG: FtsK/SpoIIIE domain-containing protein [Caldilineaceae bacterium]
MAQVGERWSGIQTSLVTIDFTDSKTWNLGTFSGSGGGKSMLLNAAVLSLLEGTPPDRVEFYMIDLDSNQYDKFRRLPHVAAVAEEEEDALVVVEYLAGIVDGNRSTDQPCADS